MEVGSCFLEDGDVCVCVDPGRAVVYCMPVSVFNCCFYHRVQVVIEID